MINRLLNVAAELRGPLLDRFSQPFGQYTVQGAHLQVDPYWYTWALRRAVFRYSPWPWFAEFRLVDVFRWISRYEHLELNWDERPDDWIQHCRMMGYTPSKDGSDPVVVHMLLRGSGGALHPIDTQIADLPREHNGHPIVYEVRPPAIATSILSNLFELVHPREQRRTSDTHAVSVGRMSPRTSGTAGGVLFDPISGRRYAVSCAHVLGPEGTETFSPGPFDGENSRSVGYVRLSRVSPIKSERQACSFHTSPDAGRLDLGVAELTADISFPSSPQRVRSIEKLLQFEPVTLSGKVSGFVEAQMNAVTIWQEIYTHPFGDGLEGYRCFGDVFELASRDGDNGPIVKPGDSGAWILDDSNDLRGWVGILFGHQGSRAYGCFAQHVMSELSDCLEFPNGLIVRA